MEFFELFSKKILYLLEYLGDSQLAKWRSFPIDSQCDEIESTAKKINIFKKMKKKELKKNVNQV